MKGVDQGETQEREKLQHSLYTNNVCRNKGVKQRVEFKSCKWTLYRLPARIFGKDISSMRVGIG